MPRTVFSRIADRAKGGPKVFARRLAKVRSAQEVASLNLMALLGADHDTSQFETLLNAVAKEIDALKVRSASNPGQAYVALGDTKEKLAKVNGHMAKAIKSCADQGKLADDGKPKWMRVFDQDVLASIQSEIGKSNFPFAGCSFEVLVDVCVPSSVYFEMQYDPLLVEKVRLPATEPYKKVLAKGIELVEAYDQAFARGNMDEVLEAYSACTSFFERSGGALGTQTEKVVLAACDKYLTLQGDYATFKFQCRAKIAIAVLGLGSGVLGLAASPLSFGFAGIVGIWQLMKSCVALAKAISDATASADGVYGNATRMYKAIVDSYQSSSKAKNTAKETGAVAINFLVGDPLFQGLPAAKAEAELAKNKYNGVELDIHRLGTELGALVEQLELIDKGCAKQANPEVVRAGAAFGDIGRKTAALLVDIPKELARVSERRQWCIDAGEALVALGKATVHVKFVDGLDKFAEMLDFGLGIGAGAAGTDFGKVADQLNFTISTFNSVVRKVDEKLAGALK